MSVYLVILVLWFGSVAWAVAMAAIGVSEIASEIKNDNLAALFFVANATILPTLLLVTPWIPLILWGQP